MTTNTDRACRVYDLNDMALPGHPTPRLVFASENEPGHTGKVLAYQAEDGVWDLVDPKDVSTMRACGAAPVTVWVGCGPMGTIADRAAACVEAAGNAGGIDEVRRLAASGTPAFDLWIMVHVAGLPRGGVPQEDAPAFVAFVQEQLARRFFAHAVGVVEDVTRVSRELGYTSEPFECTVLHGGDGDAGVSITGQVYVELSRILAAWARGDRPGALVALYKHTLPRGGPLLSYAGGVRFRTIGRDSVFVDVPDAAPDAGTEEDIAEGLRRRFGGDWKRRSAWGPSAIWMRDNA